MAGDNLFFSFLLKGVGNYFVMAVSWCKCDRHQNFMSIFLMKYTFSMLPVETFLLYTGMEYFRIYDDVYVNLSQEE